MDPLDNIKQLREDYEKALDAAETHRLAYHDAVIELHSGGMPLREIAQQLGLSHQRVHQIVSGESPRRRKLGKAAGGTAAALIVVALAIGAVAWTQSYQPLAFARLGVVPAGSFNTVGDKGEVAWVGYHTGIGGGRNRPFFGVTFQNTGPFSVRVDGLGRYWPALPQLFAGWGARLLMARYTRVGHGHAWKRGPLQPFHSVDLGPGQIVMILIQGVWDDCQIELTGGATTPPRDFPVRYSFLWKTTTTRIPFPGGLRFAPAHSPRTGCHQALTAS